MTKRQARAARRYKEISGDIRRQEALLLHLSWADAQALVEAAARKPSASLRPYQRDIIDQACEVLVALDDERRQTQRRMIAALYWRAGDAECEALYARSMGWGDAEGELWVTAHETMRAARSLEESL